MQKLKLNLEALPELVNSGIISEKEALNQLSEEFSSNPQNYFLNYRDEELVSDVIYGLLSSGKVIFKNYNRKNGPFLSYFKTYIKFQAKTVQRNLFRSETRKNHIQPLEQLDYEEQMDNYFCDEYSNRLPDLTSCFCAAEDFSLYSNLSSEKIKIRDLFLTRKNKDKKMTIVVTLKESYYVTDKIIDSVSRYCNISPLELTGNIEELKDELQKRKQKLAKIKIQRDNSYQLRRSLQMRLESKELSEETAKKLYERMMVHTATWNRRNRQINEGMYKICPSNQRISEILGISERQVGYYIQNASKLEQLLKSD